MKKLLLIVLCAIIPLTFISCGKEKSEVIEESSSSAPNTLFDLMPSRTETTSQNDTELMYKGKKVKDIKFITSIAVNMNFDAEFLKELENAENNEFVPDDSLKLLFGTLKIIYDDETDEIVGQVYFGSDSALYLKLSNSENEDVAYKISDSIY